MERIPFTDLRDIRCIQCGYRQTLDLIAHNDVRLTRWETVLCNACHEAPVVYGYEYCQACKSRRLVRRVG